MPTSYEFTLNAQDIADLIAYMMTLIQPSNEVAQGS
jgi:hypothetical protein